MLPAPSNTLITNWAWFFYPAGRTPLAHTIQCWTLSIVQSNKTTFGQKAEHFGSSRKVPATHKLAFSVVVELDPSHSKPNRLAPEVLKNLDFQLVEK